MKSLKSMPLKSIILAGGRGTRLWPLSRELMPKQFIKLFDKKSLFQMTVERALLISNPDEIFVVTNRDYKFRVLDDLDEMGVEIPKENILLEPASKNTLPAIFWGVKEIKERFGSSIVSVLPSDHFIKGNDAFLDAFSLAKKFAEKYLITFGIQPAKPHTGYGYIKPSRKIGDGVYEVDEFREKPSFELAKTYVEKGYLWNSGMFAFSTDLFIEEVEKHQPKVVECFDLPVEDAYQSLPEISIDYGVMEKTDRAAVIPMDCHWSDLGSFDSLYEVLEKDGHGNAVKVEEFAQLNSKNNLVIAERLTSMIGVRDLIVVDTDDALLIAKKGESQKVREIYGMRKERGDKRVVVHRTAYRPWGSYIVLEEGERYKIKRLTILPMRRLSLQRHYHRSEHWVVVRGTAKVVVDGKEILLRNGESTFIPAGAVHRLENPGKIPLEVIEVQIGEYLDEDDIERLEDDFGR